MVNRSGDPRTPTSTMPTSDAGRSLRPGRPPLAAVLVLPFLLQLILAVALTGWLSLHYGEQALEETTTKLRRETARRIEAYLHQFLDAPRLINEVNAQALSLGELNAQTAEPLWSHFRRQLDVLPHASFIFFGSRHGGAAGAGRPNVSSANDTRSSEATVDTTPVDPVLGLVAGPRTEYEADSQGRAGPLLRSDGGFDARQRPWYRDAVAAGEPVWSTVYPLFHDQSLAIAASRPVLDSSGELLGVTAVDLRLAGLQEFLAGIEVAATGTTFIVERQSDLIATSSTEALLVDPAQDGQWQRQSARQSENSLIRATTEALIYRWGNLEFIQGHDHLTVDLGDDEYFIDVVPFRHARGIDWLIVLVVPRSDFTAPLITSRRQTLGWMSIAFLLTTVMGLFTSRWLALPIHRLSEAAKKLAAGHLNQRVETGGSREVDELATSFNAMAGQLEGTFEGLERRVAQRTDELRLAKETAEAADRAKSRFLADVSHEVRTPLSTVLGYSELLADTPRDSAEKALYLETIRQQGRHLSQMLGELIDLGRIETERFELHLETCGLHDLFEQLRSLFMHQASNKGLALKLETEGRVPWSFKADPTRLLQILSNLLGNAIRYTHQGEVRLTVRAKPSTDSTADALPQDPPSTETQLIFEVQDTGIGIAEEDREALFRQYVRLPAGEAAATSGFGLGLAITQRLCRLMAGTVEVDSRLDEGSTFTVTLPLQGCAQWGASQPVDWHLTPQQPLGHLEGNVLITDDSPQLRTLCQHMLQRWGLQCQFAEDGHAAVRLAPTGDFDAILMDWQMPGLTGLEATQELRRMGLDTPIVALTAAAMTGDRERCLQAGCSHYLTKPIDFTRLHRILSQILSPEASPSTGVALSSGAASSKQPLPLDPEVIALTRKLLLGLPRRTRQLEAQLEAQDWTGLAATTHRLVGTVGSYGLDSITQAVETLEDAARSEDTAGCRQALKSLIGLVDDAIDSFASH